MEETSTSMKINSTDLSTYSPVDEPSILKIAAILGLLVGTLSSCALCYVYLGRKINENRTGSTKTTGITWQKLFNSLNMFSGGIFFGMSVLYLFPESSKELSSYLELMNLKTTYPLCEMFVSVGFFLVLLLERGVIVVDKIWEKSNKTSEEQPNPHETYRSHKTMEYSHINDQVGIKSPISLSSSSSPPTATTSEVIELSTITSRDDKPENKATTEIHPNNTSTRNICFHIVDQEVLPTDTKYRNTIDFCSLSSNVKPHKSGLHTRKTFKSSCNNLAEAIEELCILIPNQYVCSIENHLVDLQTGRLICQDINNKRTMFCRSHSSIESYGSTITEQSNMALHFANDKSCYHNGVEYSTHKHEERRLKNISNYETAKKDMDMSVSDTEENEGLHQSRAIILLIVLIFHSLFDGITLGLRDETLDIFTIMFALILHKCLIAFSLTLKLRETFTNHLWRVKLWLIIFSFISPIGAGIGWLLSISGVNNLAFHKGLSGILTSISTGTFLYVTFFEILGPELISHKSNSIGILSILIGFGVMACLKIL